jgi:HSP20 family protein
VALGTSGAWCAGNKGQHREDSVIMALIRWNPSTSRDLVSFQDEVNRIFDQLQGRGARPELQSIFAPPADIEETAEEFIVRLDLPGVSPKDVKVSLMGDTLTIRGERRHLHHNGGNLHRGERIHGTFERSFSLGTSVRSETVQANYRDGVLEVHVPKAEEARVREIEVQVG